MRREPLPLSDDSSGKPVPDKGWAASTARTSKKISFYILPFIASGHSIPIDEFQTITTT
jgi:hypothetical protein